MSSVLRKFSIFLFSSSAQSHFRLILRYLAHLLTPRQAEIGSPNPSNGEVQREKKHSISSSIISIGDLFKDFRDGSKSVKFPEKRIKVLEQRLEDIAMGKDPA